MHPEPSVNAVLYKIIAAVITKYPHQALWPMVGVMQSNRPDRSKVCSHVLARAVRPFLHGLRTNKQSSTPGIHSMIEDARRLSKNLLKLADAKIVEGRRDMSISTHYAYVLSVFPSKMIMPLQDALTCSLPSTSNKPTSHNPFPGSLVEIKGVSCTCSRCRLTGRNRG
jgi:serine/threonine-protein kinase ATR